MPINTGNKKSKLYLGSSKVSKAYLGSTKIYSSGNVVTYMVRGVIYTQEYDEGESVISPSAVNLSLPGATFLGWSTSANSTSVVLNLTMSKVPITLYAVYKYDDVEIPKSKWYNQECGEYGSYRAYELTGFNPTISSATMQSDGIHVYSDDTDIYSKYTITAYTGPMSNVQNSTTGETIAYVKANNTIVRKWARTRGENSELGSELVEYEGFPGENGNIFTLTVDVIENGLYCGIEAYTPWPAVSKCNFYISKIIGVGKTFVG